MASEAVLYAYDLDHLAAFYAEGIGLTLGETGDDYRQLRGGDFILWLVRGQAPAPQRDADGNVMRRSDVALKLGFAVSSLEQTAASVQRLGGMVARRSWEFAGSLRRDAVDPEGNVVALLEALSPR